MTKAHSGLLKWMLTVFATVAGIALAAYWFVPRFGVTPIDEGRAAFERGDYREARSIAVKVLLKSPEDRGAKQIVARASARLGDDETAQRLYRSMGDEGMEADDFFELGSSMERRSFVVQAIALLERGLSIAPNHPEILQGLARLYARDGRLLEAIEAAKQLAERPGWEARGALILGVLETENADPPATATALDRAFKADPRLIGGITEATEARKLLARALLQTVKPDQALAALEPVLSKGTDTEAIWLSGRAFLQKQDVLHATEALTSAVDFGKDDPTRPDPAPYVGAKACMGCHKSIFEAHEGSRHSRTYSAIKDLKSLALPKTSIADTVLPGTSHKLSREGEAIRLTTTQPGEKDRVALVAFAVGSGDRGLTMVAHDDTGMARVCRISSYLNGTLWDMTSHAADPHPDDLNGPLGRPMSQGATNKCVDCHVTSLPAARDRNVPEAADRGIGCERCHGPGGNHLTAMNLGFPDPAIGRPSRASADQITRLCGTCHKADDPSTSETDPRFVRFQASTLPQSRCYTESQGALSCTTCHDPHRDADPKPASYEARCLSCHGTGPAKTSRVHCPVNPSTGCVTCHMPKVEGAAPHALFTDHQIRVHKTKPTSGGPVH